MSRNLQLVSDFGPAGGQPQAIAALLEGLEAGLYHQTLLGVTGSGKTYTIANVIQAVQRPAPGGSWAGPLATLALIAFAGWVVAAVAFIAFVIGTRRRKAQRRASVRTRR